MTFPILEVERKDDPDGAWITMAVRMKLDLVGLKISLEDWQALGESERDRLHAMSADDEVLGGFANELRAAMLAAERGEPSELSERKRRGPDAWRDPGPVPESVTAASARTGVEVDWPGGDRFTRFVLSHYAGREDDRRFRLAADELNAARASVS